MRMFGFLVLALTIGICLFGCGKKQQALEELQEPMSIEALSTVPTQGQAVQTEVKMPETKPQAPVETAIEAKPAAQMPAAEISKPSAQDIQKALKNAGVYNGQVDGKIGPMTKKAIEEFQKANGLKVDGKVGPKTWELLSKHLDAPAAPAGSTGGR